MDQRSNQTLAADESTDLSVSSVASSLADLDLNLPPISRLPNKLLQRILSKVERMVPFQKFVRFCDVDTRWRSVVVDIFKDKKSLILVIRDKDSRGKLQMEDFFFGLLNETNSMCAIIRAHEDEDDTDDEDCVYYVCKNIFKSLLKVLPNIVQLYIYCSDSNGLDFQIAEYVNSLVSLKRLYVYGCFEHLLHMLERAVYSEYTSLRLDFFFFHRNSSRFPIINCIRSVAINFDYVRQLHARAPRWLVNVTQLSFTIELDDQFDQVLPFLREHVPLLDVLHIKFCDTAQITPALFGHLGKLTRLKEIALGPVQFEVLKQVAAPLATITTCNLVISDFDFRSVTVDQFISVLIAIFPRVVKWKFAFVPNGNGDSQFHSFSHRNFQKKLRNNITRGHEDRCQIFDNNLNEFFKLLNYYSTFYTRCFI